MQSAADKLSCSDEPKKMTRAVVTTAVLESMERVTPTALDIKQNVLKAETACDKSRVSDSSHNKWQYYSSK